MVKSKQLLVALSKAVETIREGDYEIIQSFMGFRFYRNRVTLRRKIALKAMRKARRIAKKKHTTVHDARQMLTYIGWSKCTDSYNWVKKYILCHINFRELRKIVSNYDKRRTLYVV